VANVQLEQLTTSLLKHVIPFANLTKFLMDQTVSALLDLIKLTELVVNVQQEPVTTNSLKFVTVSVEQTKFSMELLVFVRQACTESMVFAVNVFLALLTIH
jgi:hypothetical protein